MENNYKYIETNYSELASFNFVDTLQFWSVEFNYDLNRVAQKTLGINADVIFKTKMYIEGKEILKSHSYFVITRNEEIVGEELYKLIEHSIKVINIFLREKHLLLHIPVLEVPCPSLDEMKAEMNNLAICLNQELKK